MAISDFYEPLTYGEIFKLRQLEKNALFLSGAGVSDPELDRFLVTEGRKHDQRFINQLSITEPNQGDDSSTDATPGNRDGVDYQVVKHIVNNGWTDYDIVTTVNGIDSIVVTANQIMDYWNGVSNFNMIYSGMGVLADNIANDAGDMRYNASILSGTLADTNYISAENIISAQGTLGDHLQDIKIMVMHSIPFIRLQNLQLIDAVPDSDQKVFFPTYQGKIVLVDDNMPVDTTVSGFPVYTTMLLGAGAYAFGIADQAKNPMALERAESKGNGQGQETLWSRKNMIVHPQGFDYSNTTNTSWTNLQSAANWNRKVERKRCKMAFLQTNG